MRARRSARSASGTWIVNGRIALAVFSTTAVITGSASRFRTYGEPQRSGLTQEPRSNATGAIDAYRGASTVLGRRHGARAVRPTPAWRDRCVIAWACQLASAMPTEFRG